MDLVDHMDKMDERLLSLSCFAASLSAAFLACFIFSSAEYSEMEKRSSSDPSDPSDPSVSVRSSPFPSVSTRLLRFPYAFGR